MRLTLSVLVIVMLFLGTAGCLQAQPVAGTVPGAGIDQTPTAGRCDRIIAAY